MSLNVMMRAEDKQGLTEEKSESRYEFCGANGQNGVRSNYCQTCAAHKTALCSRLKGDDLTEFGMNSLHKTFEAGQILFTEYDDAKYYYTVVSGDVRLSRMLDDGRRQITGFKSAGDFIGLGVNGHFTADAEAINEVTVCQFSVNSLNQSLEKYAEVQGRLMEMMQDEVIKLQDHMLLLGRKTPVEKIAYFLCERAKKAGKAQESGKTEVQLPMSRTDVADFLGLTIETVSRTITKLRKSGVIELKTSQHILVKDLDQLKLLANGED